MTVQVFDGHCDWRCPRRSRQGTEEEAYPHGMGGKIYIAHVDLLPIYPEYVGQSPHAVEIAHDKQRLGVLVHGFAHLNTRKLIRTILP